MILLWIIIPLFIVYSLLIIYFWLSWKSISPYIPGQGTAKTKISVIIPARNEEKTIGLLLSALQQQTYPREFFEVIVIDDHSEDNTTEVVKSFDNIRLLSLKEETINSYKKKAIETGINASTGELIVTTDADCVPPVSWLELIASFKEEKRAVFIAAPVVIDCNSSIVQLFQAMDFMILQGITGAAVNKNSLSMCNGANLAYEKNVFNDVNGFAGINNIASGDDMLLMHKIWKKFPEHVYYIKSRDAIVSTQPVRTWKEFFNQRIRWASKARQYDDKRILPVLLLVYLFNLSFPALIIAGFWNFYYWLAVIALWLLKTLVELPFFSSVSDFFGKRWAVKWFIFFQPLHILYTIVSGLFGQFGKYEWKGRRVN
jgi:poly-beta-1,6-N-acetyl-D-glucosamine synthase